METELTYAACVGNRNFNSYKTTNWYGDLNIPISKDTRCEYCKKHIEALGSNTWYEIIPRTNNITCDSINDPYLSMMEAGPFRFQITTPDRSTPFLVHPPSSPLRQNGEFVVEMTPKTNYAITIDPQIAKQPIPIYYSVDITVGGAPVTLQATPTLYTNVVTVYGFSTNQPFEFVSENKNSETLEMVSKNFIKLHVLAYVKEANTYKKLYDLELSIQLAYINVEIYQSPNHYNTLLKITEDAKDYYHVLAQKRRREEAIRLGLLNTISSQ